MLLFLYLKSGQEALQTDPPVTFDGQQKLVGHLWESYIANIPQHYTTFASKTPEIEMLPGSGGLPPGRLAPRQIWLHSDR